MTTKRFWARRLLSCGMAALCAAGCGMLPGQNAKSTPPPTPAPVMEASPSAPVGQPLPEQVALDQGIALYNDGDYSAAVRKLSSSGAIWGGDKAVRLKALKYMAFSYCVMGRQPACRQEFEKALKLDPSFDLDQGEKGHPLWGPVFEKAKKRARK